MALISCFFRTQLDTSLHCKTTDTGLVYLMMYLFTVYAPDFAGRHCTYLQRDDQSVMASVHGAWKPANNDW